MARVLEAGSGWLHSVEDGGGSDILCIAIEARGARPLWDLYFAAVLSGGHFLISRQESLCSWVAC